MENSGAVSVSEVSFLDLVREVAALSLGRCTPGCWEEQHRREAAEILGVLLENPSLITELVRISDRAVARRAAVSGE